MQYILNVQRTLGQSSTVEVGYLGSQSRHLDYLSNQNQGILNAALPVAQRLPYPEWGASGIQYLSADGTGNYNALSAKLTQRFRDNLDTLIAYTWSKSLDTGTGNGHGSGVDIYQDAYNPAANYGLSDFNAANTLAGEIVYELPFGTGRQFALHGPLNQIAGGWRISTIFQWHGGVPYTPIIQYSIATALDPGLTPSLNAGSMLYPVQVGDPKSSQHSTVDLGTGSHFGRNAEFIPTAFANPAAGTFGTAGRNTLIGPGYSNVDLSLGKVFRLTEKVNFEFRADAYNAFNHVNYGNPDANVGGSSSACAPGTPDAGLFLADCSAGVSNGPAGFVSTMRIIQLGARLTF